MVEIAGAGAERERVSELLDGELTRVVSVAAPGDPVVPTRKPEWSALDYTGHFRYRAEVRVQTTAAGRPETVTRAAQALREAGWVTTGPTRTDDDWLEVKGHRDGFTIDVRASPSGFLLFRGSTPEVQLREPDPYTPPAPAVTEETLPPGFELCRECRGRGYCNLCEGRSWLPGGRPCVLCSLTRHPGRCHVCDGDGEFAVSRRPHVWAPESPDLPVGCGFYARNQQIVPDQILAARLTSQPSRVDRSGVEEVLAVRVNDVEVRLMPPTASGSEVVFATPEDWVALRAAGYELPQAALVPAPAAAKRWYAKGRSSYDDELMSVAIEYLSRAIALDPGEANYYYVRGYIYSVLLKAEGRYVTGNATLRRRDEASIARYTDHAISDYTKAAECDPTLAAAYGMRGEMHYLKGDHDAARADLEYAAGLGDEIARNLLRKRFSVD
jgi:hypothetical protein